MILSTASASDTGPAAQAAHTVSNLGGELPLWSVLPFVALLLAIAILPLTHGHWWERLRNRAWVAGLLSVPILLLFLPAETSHLVHAGVEYVAFIVLLGSLFTISGGIRITGDLRATPLVNAGFLLTGALLANVIGTTGASMLLIRPFLETNRERRNTRHLPIFFIFLVANIGGCLTPLGDPPLFLGFLRGVPFTWTLQLWPAWLLMMGLVTGIFLLVDTRAWRQEEIRHLRHDRTQVRPLRIEGAGNLGYLLGIVGAVFLPLWWRVLAMSLLAFASYRATSRRIHEENRFSFFPINEVAILFAGIFVTMVPALLILEARGASLGIHAPWQFFWLTGGLSSFLDNAPTYLTFASLALGVLGAHGSDAGLHALALHPEGAALLRAISLGAVFMGANTYIGNGPNFMVKSIVEERRLPMPSFFGYMAWSVGILVPCCLIVTWVFFRPSAGP